MPGGCDVEVSDMSSPQQAAGGAGAAACGGDGLRVAPSAGCGEAECPAPLPSAGAPGCDTAPAPQLQPIPGGQPAVHRLPPGGAGCGGEAAAPALGGCTAAATPDIPSSGSPPHGAAISVTVQTLEGVWDLALPDGQATKLVDLRRQVAKRANCSEDAVVLHLLPPEATARDSLSDLPTAVAVDGGGGRGSVGEYDIDDGAVLRLQPLPRGRGPAPAAKEALWQFTLKAHWRGGGKAKGMVRELPVSIDTPVHELRTRLAADGAFNGLKSKELRLACDGNLLRDGSTIGSTRYGIDGFGHCSVTVRERNRLNPYAGVGGGFLVVLIAVLMV
eukprot:gene8275-21551_t